MGAQENSHTSNNSMQRVKVYRMDSDGKWSDKGTGHVTVDYLERSEELGLFVFDEVDNETLLSHRISAEHVFRKQEDKIISWRDPEFTSELALSFQETAGCSYIWDQICNVQRSLQFSALNSDAFHNVNSELRELPAVELSSLPLILKIVTECGITDQMRLTDLILNDQDFFRKLMHLFRICEDLENVDGLRMICKIVRGIILLNSPHIFEKIFGDDLIMDIIGSLEYDPEVRNIQHHRDFLKDHVVFKEAIPIKDPLVLSKIHQTYRVGYLKDVVLARVLDDGTIVNLNSIIHSNNAVVVSLLKDDSTFIQELFARLRSPSTSAESKRNMVHFLHEFCSLSKSLQMVQQLRLFRDLVNEGIFDIITDVLQSQDKRLVLTGTDILILFMNQDPNLLRSYVVRQEGIQLLELLVKGMITDFGEDMHCQFLEIIRSLLDPYTLSGSQRDKIIDIFYEQHLGQLINAITASCPCEDESRFCKPSGSVEEVDSQTHATPKILLNICELLCFCVIHHPCKIKCNFLLNNVIDKVLLLTRRREKYLVVAAVRFVRTILSHHDEYLINHFVKNNFFKPIIDVFDRSGNHYNLLHSAVLDLLEYIRKENLKPLLKYIVDSFWKQLVNFEHLASIHSFKVKYDQLQYMESSGPKNTVSASDTRKRIGDRALEKEEEDYFKEDSDEEDTASASQTPKAQPSPTSSNGSYSSLSPRSKGLVDYDDDDDDDYKPPPKKPQNMDEDEEALVSLRLKRKVPLKDKESESLKKNRLAKNSKSRESVFVALCSTLSQTVLPGKKSSNSINSISKSVGDKGNGEEKNQEKECEGIPKHCPENKSCSTEDHNSEKESDTSRNPSDSINNVEQNKQASSEDSPSTSPRSSETTVNRKENQQLS